MIIVAQNTEALSGIPGETSTTWLRLEPLGVNNNNNNNNINNNNTSFIQFNSVQLNYWFCGGGEEGGGGRGGE